nr:MAG TPA: hypothetical protein [Caudoviricetes sp.]
MLNSNNNDKFKTFNKTQKNAYLSGAVISAGFIEV